MRNQIRFWKKDLDLECDQKNRIGQKPALEQTWSGMLQQRRKSRRRTEMHAIRPSEVPNYSPFTLYPLLCAVLQKIIAVYIRQPCRTLIFPLLWAHGLISPKDIHIATTSWMEAKTTYVRRRCTFCHESCSNCSESPAEGEMGEIGASTAIH
jgi:hypothetical protein